MYAHGNAGVWSTYRGNVQAFEKYRIIPRMLVDATTRDLQVRTLHENTASLPTTDAIRYHRLRSSESSIRAPFSSHP